MSAWLIGCGVSLYLLAAWRLLPWFVRAAHERFAHLAAGTSEGIAAALLWPVVFICWGANLTGRWLLRIANSRAYANSDMGERTP